MMGYLHDTLARVTHAEPRLHGLQLPGATENSCQLKTSKQRTNNTM